jgi:hypothetical protein
MTDYRSLPAWTKAMGLAHAVYAAAEAAGIRETDAGRRLRKTVVAVPSLVAEAWTGHEELRGEPLDRAEDRLSELQQLLSESASPLPAVERLSLLEALAPLREELRMLRT